ncbi:unnamed protein product [Orchesella dallaii]|uniref:Uncharacterized protein n=1 Tax=Orchesella dallaii TaxID=48710 RepID=A0ABP1QRL3_9HEXA
MDFKRHQQHQHINFNYNPRPSNNHAGIGTPGGFPSFVSPIPHHQHQPHSARGYRPSDANNGRLNLNLTHSLTNLLKLNGDLVSERTHCFQNINHYRDVMAGRIIGLTRDLFNDLNDENLDRICSNNSARVQSESCEQAFVADKEGEAADCGSTTDNQPISIKSPSEIMGVVNSKVQVIKQRMEKILLEEMRAYAQREQSLLEGILSRERRVEKEFLEFFNDAERQIIEYEKKARNDGHILGRLRNAERDIEFRDDKILQLEDSLAVVSDRLEKVMAELQQVNADHQFEKLQLYHHVEVCKVNAKCLAMEELLRCCKWKRCLCGREYENELLQELEASLQMPTTSANVGFPNIVSDTFARSSYREIRDCNNSKVAIGGPHFNWNLHTYQSMMTPSHPMPTGSFIPSEEAATKGIVLNDLRDRYDDLQLKAAAMPNYEEVRTMIMKIVCHFKVGGLRVCEEIGGKKFVSTLFYCNTEDLVPSKDGKIFSTGYGDNPEEATKNSVQRAFDEIQRMETLNIDEAGMDMTFVRRNPLDSKIRFDTEPVRMTLLQSYSRDTLSELPANTRCSQEAFLYKNNSNATEKYMIDWKIHIRIDDVHCRAIKEQLKKTLSIIKNEEVDSALKEKTGA